jgi:polyhydroxyalkanoate synthesis regulator phasin
VSSGVSAADLGRMDEPARSHRERAERLGLAAVGAVVLTAERMDELAAELAARGGMRRDEAREVLEEAVARWRADASRFVERAGSGLQGIVAHLGFVERDEFEDLELRLAQAEHRLRLLESASENVTRSVQD